MVHLFPFSFRRTTKASATKGASTKPFQGTKPFTSTSTAHGWFQKASTPKCIKCSSLLRKRSPAPPRCFPKRGDAAPCSTNLLSVPVALVRGLWCLQHFQPSVPGALQGHSVSSDKLRDFPGHPHSSALANPDPESGLGSSSPF